MHYNIDIDSYIGWPISASWVKSNLSKFQGKECTVRVNSFGGSVRDGLDIRQQFSDHGQTDCYIFGMTASAATILAMGARKIYMSKYAVMMIHQCSNWVDAWGQMNSDEIDRCIEDLKKTKRDLDNIDQVVASLYAERTGKDIKEIAAVMKEGRWLTADDCKRLGLVDEIIEDGEEPDVEGMRNQLVACGLPVPTQKEGNRQPDLVTRIVQGVRNAFGIEDKPSTQTNQPTVTAMKKETIACLLAVLCIEALEAKDGKVELTTDQVQNLSDRLKALQDSEKNLKDSEKNLKAEKEQLEKDKKDLEEQLQNLKKGDGDETHHNEGTDGDADPEINNTIVNTLMNIM